MRHIYSSCDILLKMSRVESFAYPPLEAMACGCRAGRSARRVEYAQDEVNLLMVAAGDVAQARAAVERLMADESLRERLRLAGYETVRNWNWEASSAAMTAVLADTQEENHVASLRPTVPCSTLPKASFALPHPDL